MAKIKSTLDIVMERTRNLSLTDEEKTVIHRKELDDKVRGWVQMLVDHKYTVSNLESAYLEELSHSPGVKDVLRRELLEHIDPDTDNASILDAWRDILNLDDGFISEAVVSYRTQTDQSMREYRERIREELVRSGISGSAVIPNVLSSPEWEAARKIMKERFMQALQTG